MYTSKPTQIILCRILFIYDFTLLLLLLGPICPHWLQRLLTKSRGCGRICCTSLADEVAIYACIRWGNSWSTEFAIEFGVRQGSVISPFLFAIYLDDLAALCKPERKLLIVLYADDILLLAPTEIVA